MDQLTPLNNSSRCNILHIETVYFVLFLFIQVRFEAQVLHDNS
jgi:hypothetical protein